MTLSLRGRMKILIYVGAGLVLLVSVVDGEGAVGLSVSRLAYVEVGIFALVVAFDRWLWRIPIVLKIFRTGPLLLGTWKGVINPTDGERNEIPAYLIVRQTFSGLKLRLVTEESMSDSTTAQLHAEDEGLAVLEFSYQNIPRDSARVRSAIHFGSVRSEILSPRPQEIEGSYFTSRKTTGELRFSERKKVVALSFSEATKLYE